ncbi:MAG: hypothetical protein LBE84_02515, partial [Planctomycetota bacterium]|nr:hypothetical protein [Planctomycetota bacterium]
MRKLDKSMVSGLAALSLAVVMLNHLIFKDAILEWNPSPLWLIVILIPLRYGSPAGIIAGVTAAVIYLTELVALGHNFQELMHMNPAMLLIPTLFIFVGIYTGETREHLGQRSEFFKNEVDRLNAVLDSNETIRMNLERTNLEFQKRIAGQTNTLLGVHADLNRLSSATSEEELWQLLTDIVQRETKAESCVVWEIGKSVIVAVTGAALESVPPLAHLAARKRRLTTLIDWVENYGDAEKPGAEIAVILSDDPDKKLVLTASGVGFGNLNRAAIVFFDMAAQWAGATAAEFRRLDSL